MVNYTLFIAALLLTACTATQTDTIEIGGLLGLTGISQQFGEDERMGAELAIEEINARGGVDGRPVELIMEDGQTDLAATLSAYRKLVDVDGVDYIIGTTWGWPAQPIVPHLQEDDVILISPSAGEADIEAFNDENFFKTYPPYKLETGVLVEHMERSGVDAVSVVTSDGSFENTMRAGFIETLAGSDITVTEHIVSGTEKDFKTLIEKLKLEDPDALYVVIGDYSAQGEFHKQAQQRGLSIPTYTYSGIENHELLGVYGTWMEGIIYPISDFDQRDRAFNERFAARYGREPVTPAAATAYDAVMMLAIALERGESSSAVKQGLHAIEGYQGASAIRGFDSNGWPVTDKQYKLRTVRNSSFADLE